MAFDECPSSVADRDYMENSVNRTTRWLKRCKAEMDRLNSLPDTINKHQMLFGINQGGVYEDCLLYTSILQDQKRLRVINALGHAYSSISLVNIKTGKIEIVKSSRNMKPDQKGDILSKAHLEELIQQVITDPFQEKYREFINMSTVTQRLEERETLSFPAQTVEGRWLTIIIVPQGYDLSLIHI